MMAPRIRTPYTVDQYLAIERASEERYEYLDGDIYAMAGESPEHGDISANVMVSLGGQLKGTSCRARTKDTKVRSGPLLKAGETVKVLFSYPDILVVCGEPEYADKHRDIILNPKVIVEVLSKTTENFDRGEKFTRYQTWNPSLTDYLLIRQDRRQVEHYTRQDDGSWTYRLHTGLDATVEIASIQCKLALRDVYERVVFAEE
jgi:Uma2 family endonuclease